MKKIVILAILAAAVSLSACEKDVLEMDVVKETDGGGGSIPPSRP